MKKLYYADVAIGLFEYFERKLEENGATIVSRVSHYTLDTHKPYYRYLIIAEEGAINPKWEVKIES